MKQKSPPYTGRPFGLPRIATLIASGLLGFTASGGFSQTATVAVDRTTAIGTSQFYPGISQIDHSLDDPWTGNDSTAVANARTLVAEGIHWVNNHMMQWGVDDPWPDPSQSAPSQFGLMDLHVQRIIDLGATPILTLCEAPWWMKGQLKSDGSTALIPTAAGDNAQYTYSSGVTDFRGKVYPAGYVSPYPYACRVLDNQISNWLILVEAVARRYMVAPYNVRYFQVWNELKGYNNPTASPNVYDYTTSAGDPSDYNAKHGYTFLYNQTYDRLRSVASSLGISPTEIHIGGPYPVMDSGASAGIMSNPSSVTGSWGVLDQRPLDVISYWLANKTGGEFCAIDGYTSNKFGGNITDQFTRCEKFAAVNSWIRSQPGGATLPIVWSEWYTSSDSEPAPSDLSNALGTVSAIQQIKSGAWLTLLWGGQYTAATRQPLWTSTSVVGGGTALPFYSSYRDLGVFMGAGTTLYAATSSNSDVAVLASAARTVLVNKTNSAVTVNLDGASIALAAYGVSFVTPPSTYVIDNADTSGVTLTGTWISSTNSPGYYGTNYLTDNNTGSSGGKSVRLRPSLPVTGRYEVYLRWTANSNRATNTPVDVIHTGGTSTFSVNQQLNNNTWVLLGTFNFAAGTAGSVLVRNDSANGYVIVDAAEFVLKTPLPATSLTAATVNSSQIKLTWADTSNDETGFDIRRANSPTGSYSTIASVGANATTYTDTGRAADTAYYYQVVATNAAGSAGPSNQATATTAAHEYYEAEWATVAATSGDATSVFSESPLSGGQGLLLSSDALNDYVTVALNVPEARTYSVMIGVKKFTSRGKFTLSSASSLAGTYTNIGAEQDLYSASAQYLTLSLGSRAFTTAGTNYFRFKVTNKNASSSGYTLGFDYFVLTPQ